MFSISPYFSLLGDPGNWLWGARVNHLWYALPLIVSVSLVYSATRNESMKLILAGAARVGTMISVFLLGVLLFLYVVSSQL